MKIEIRKGRSGKWYWRIKARNGEILCNSETYSSKGKARHGVYALIKKIHTARIVILT